MLSFFESIIAYLEIAWGFFLNLCNSLFSLFTALLSAVMIPDLVATRMWGPIGACCLALTGFAIIKMIVGRSSV